MASGSGKGHFNPRSPHGERRDGSSLSIIDFVFQPTLPARGATKMTTGLRASTFEFQPTLPARGATVSRDVSGRPGANFNPRSPHGERLRLVFRSRREWSISTHAPRTGSDTTNCIVEISTTHFNPRSPHGERRGLLLVRWDIPSFQPTLPARGATTRRKAI
mgnify:CR=1 FL=1